MNCLQNQYKIFNPPHPYPTGGRGGGSFRGNHLKVTISIKFKKVSQNAIILSDYTANIPGEAGSSEEEGRE